MKVAIYPGTFDPITYGHLDILRKATQIFDKVVLAVAEHTGKNTLFTTEERKQLCLEAVKGIDKVDVKSYNGLSVKFCRGINATHMIRGLRAVSDFEYELQIALFNKKLDQELETVFLIPDNKYLYLSSSMVRSVYELSGELQEFIPECAVKALNNKIGEKK